MPGPPPPPPPTFNLGGGGSAEQGRGALLQSIRAGKPLKKTVTVDKSAPAVSGKIISSTTSLTSASSTNSTLKTSLSNNGNGCANSNNGNPVGLGGLFAGGMPKLKPTGLRNNLNTEKSNQQPVIGSATLPNINKRGPPPVPPPATQKPQIFTAVPAQVAQENTSNSESPRGYGKPTIAPKPPGQQQQQQKPSPPPKKLSLMTNNSVSRAQSMRLTRSPPVLAPAPPSFHQSKEVLYDPQPRPVTRALRPPGVRPPSPPVSKTNGTNSSSVPITRVAPPPPCRAPSIPPPPPPLPHRGSTSSSSSSNLQQPVPHTRLAPPVPPSVTPPTPPTRNQSLRNGQNNSNPNTATNFVNNNASPAEFEARFIDFFHSIANFPAPEAFRNVTKVYNSRTVAAAKQQAPAPPMRSVSNAGTSLSGTKSQWSQQQQNATSSAC